MHRVFDILERAAPFPATIMLVGESGTGKRLCAKTVWSISDRSGNPWQTFDCSSIPESLLESRLFGHVEGAFTDAIEDRAGVFEEADGGTLFISALANTPPSVQVRFLRVLQEGVVQRLGENRERPVNVRLITSLPTNIRQLVEEGAFREDLYYRLNVIEARIPALRERVVDLPLLIEEFTDTFAEELGVPELPFSEESLSALANHEWPGNVRELRNVVQRCLVLAEGQKVEITDLPPNIARIDRANDLPMAIDGDDLSIKKWTRELEEHLIRRALKKSEGNKTRAAELLELSYRALLYKMKEYFPDGVE